IGDSDTNIESQKDGSKREPSGESQAQCRHTPAIDPPSPSQPHLRHLVNTSTFIFISSTVAPPSRHPYQHHPAATTTTATSPSPPSPPRQHHHLHHHHYLVTTVISTSHAPPDLPPRHHLPSIVIATRHHL
nr:hypothetical protein [Tanacetum cinerariifolium]